MKIWKEKCDMEPGNDNKIEEKISKQMAGWHMPFDANQPARAKARIMDMIGEDSVLMEDNLSSNRKLWFGIAAGLALLIAASASVGVLGKKEYKNTYAEHKSINLPDGSKITLSPNSQLSYNRVLWNLSRSIDFKGEAYFEVEKGSDFNVNTSKGDITVLGTRFSVWADQDDLMVHCSEGIVKVSNGAQDVVLSKNQFTHHQSNGLAAQKTLVNEGFLAPRKNFDSLTFNDVPMAAVIHELELVLGAEIKCALNIDKLTYSGTLNPHDFKTCFDVLCKPFGAKHKRDPNGIFVIYE